MSKLDEARIALEVAACEYAETGRAKPGTAKMLQAARDFAAAEAEGLYERWYRGLPAHNEYESGREDGHDRLTEALRSGGLAMEAGDD